MRKIFRLIPGLVFGTLTILALLASAPASMQFGVPDQTGLTAVPSTLALTRALHGALTREQWVAVHGATLPAELIMTRGGTVRVVTVAVGWTLAGQGWTTEGWCAR
jgi:hypothetical protein